MTFNEYGILQTLWSVSGPVLKKAFSDSFLNVGSAEEPIAAGSRFAQRGPFLCLKRSQTA